MKIRLHSGAKQDFDEAVRHYEAIRPDLAARFINEVDAGFGKIVEDPLRWRVVDGDVRRLLIKVFPFALLYIVEGETAYVLAVAHNSREPGYWADRAPG